MSIRCASVIFSLCAMSAMAQTTDTTVVVATLAGEPITTQEIIEYSRPFPQLRPYLGVPGGPMRILRQMLFDRVLVLEGERLDIPRDGTSGDTEYAHKVQTELLEPCPDLSETEALAFFEENPELFSTPLLLRVQRIGLRVDEDSNESVLERFDEIRAQVENGELDFAVAAEKYSEDIIGKSRGGDIGFLPLNPDRKNPIMEELKQTADGEIVGPIRQADMMFLYRVTDRREPVLASFESVQDQIGSRATAKCRQQQLHELRERLWVNWSVEILVPEIGISSQG